MQAAKPVVVNGTTFANLSMAKYTPADSADVVSGNSPFVKYGENNDFPDYLIRLYLSSPVHGALTMGIAQMVAGKQINTDAPISEKDLRAMCLDYIIHGGCYVQLYPSLDGSVVAKIEYLPYERCRLMREDEDEKIHGIYYSRDWSNPRGANSPIPLYRKREDGQTESYVDWSFNPTPGSMYYPKPNYVSGINWIEASENISEFHVNNLLNGLFPSMLVTIVNAHATPEEKDEDRRELSKNQGAKSAGKWMMIHTDSPQNAPIFTPVPVSDADKQYQYLSEESAKQIFIAHRVTSPLLFGIRDSSGLGSNKDEMSEALAIFTEKVIEPSRQIIAEVIERAGFSIRFIDDIDAESMPALPAGSGAEASGDIDIAATALNGAQITSLVEIVIQAATDAIPKNSAKAIIKAGFPMLTDTQVEAIFTDIVPGSIPQQPALMKSVLSAIGAKDMTKTDEDRWMNHLESCGERVDLDEWEVYEERFVDTLEEPIETKARLSAEQKSQWGDSGLYKLRFRYSTNISDNSRDFCKRMVALSEDGVLYRKEDIDIMSDSGVNGKFAPEGQTTYDIFKWKGGAYCHHAWVRVIFIRKRDKNGKILPPSKTAAMENDKRVANNPYVPKKGDEGVKPINTSSRGSLKYG